MSNPDSPLFEDPTLLLEFIAESLEHLESIESKILEYENAPEDKDLINSIFRAIHSIKGAASFFDLTDISGLSHKLETLLNDLRNDRREQTPEILDILLSGSDILGTLIKQLSESTDNQIQSQAANTDEVMEKLEIILSGESPPSSDNAAPSGNESGNDETPESVETAQTSGETPGTNAAPPPEAKKKPVAKSSKSSGYEITPQIMQNFKVEATENLQLAEDAVMIMEKDRQDKSQIDSVFRGVHTIKGASDYLGLGAIKTFAHEFESLLDVMRKLEHFTLGGSVTDVLLESIDTLRTMCDSPQESESTEVSELLERIHKELENVSESSNQAGEADDASESSETENEEDSSIQVFITSANQYLDSIRNCQKRAADGEANDKTLATYLRTVTTLKNSANYMGFANVVETTSSQETLLNIIKNLGFTKEFVELLNDDLALLEKAIEAVSSGEATPSSPAEESNAAEEMQPETQTATAVMVAEDETEDPTTEFPPETDSDQEAVETRPVGEPETEEVKTEDSPPEAPSNPEPVAEIPPVQAAKPTPEKTPPKAAAPKVQSVKTMRIEEEKLDIFMSLVGELIISKNTFSHISRRLENNTFDETTLSEFQAAMFAVNRITGELQNNVMAMRMIPVKTVFQRFPRLVRDLAKKKDKIVELNIRGEDTELDKGIAEAIGDPLVHLIRNSVDHGLESTEERKAAGKDTTGHVILSASHEGNNIVIEVVDDGKGINTEKVLKKAIEKGVIKAEDANGMSHDKILNLIFLPGFSTADKVTDVSGRGVGMDVVNTNIAKLNGTVKLDSEEGQGTTIRVELPLTLAIIDALLVNVCKRDFAIPLDSVLETIQVTPDEITVMQKKEVVLLRGETIGISRLRDILNLEDSTAGDEEGNQHDQQKIPIVIIAVGSRKVGVVVDKLMDQEEIVIKPLHESLSVIPGIGGASIMGDGRIILVLDPLELLTLTET